MWDEIMEQPVSIRRCLDVNYDKVVRFVSEIEDREIDLICIAARGTSDHAGVFGKYVFETVNGIPVSLSAPSVHTVYNRELKYKNALVIGISQSGKAEDVLEVIRHAKAQGCVTVGITNDSGSVIARETEYHFSCEAGLEKSVAATKTFSAQMLILSLLAAVWARDKELIDKLFRIPDQIADTLLLADEIKEKASRYRYMNECFVLARGINYSIALETALKIQETSYVRARGYAISDFYHGPMAMVEKDMPIFIFAPKGPVLEQTKEMIRRLKDIGAEIIVISDDEESLALGNTSFRICDTDHDVVSAFLNIVAAQQFACQLTTVKGVDPDNPRGLKKVTVTR